MVVVENTQKYALRDDNDDECRDKPARSRSWLRYQPTEMVVVITPQGGHGFAMNVVINLEMSLTIKFIVMSVVKGVVT